MDYLKLFFIRYFILLCVSAVLYITSIQRYQRHKRISICMIIITSLVLFLAISNIIEGYGKDTLNASLTTLFAFFGYILRPICIYVFIVMSGVKLNVKTATISFLPLLANIAVYFLAFIPSTKDLVFSFHINDIGNLAFSGGYLRFTSHIISLGYLLWLMYLSFAKLKARHLTNSLSNLICALFIVLAVVIETFLNDDGEVFLLNTTIGVCALEYYLFLYTERTQLDSLTGLFSRETYYHDLKAMDKTITAVIQFDMNGLKYINDNLGHFVGDKALSTIANIIKENSKKGMYAYRLGGDEFTILANNCSEEEVKATIKGFNKSLSDTTYYCSVGYAYRNDKTKDIDDLLKEAETKMYEAKNRFYANSPFERRKV